MNYDGFWIESDMDKNEDFNAWFPENIEFVTLKYPSFSIVPKPPCIAVLLIN